MTVTTSATEQLAQHIVATGYEDLPRNVIETAKWFLLDTFGTAWAGTNAPGAEELRRTVFADCGDGDASVLATQKRVPPGSAALLDAVIVERTGIHPV